MHNDRHTITKAVNENENIAVYSSLNQIEATIKNKSFAIKYVIEGTEHYETDGNKYAVHAGEYLLLNGECDVKVNINSQTAVKGLCINLQPNLLNSAIAYYCNPNAVDIDNNLTNFFNANFLYHKYTASKTILGGVLNQVSNNLNYLSATGLECFYYTLAAKIVEDQIPIYKQLQNIPSQKQATKKELWRRIANAKEFIDCNFNKTLPVKKIASEAALSEFHFFRLFKNIIGITPHQYILKKRLTESKNILLQNNYSVSDAAERAGFNDIYSFSKAFKKEFGMAPSNIGVN